MASKKEVTPKSVEKDQIISDEIDKDLDSQQSEIDQEIDLEKAEEETDTSEVISAEVEAINTDNETAKQASEKSTKPKKKVAKTKTKTKSKLYLKTIDGFEINKTHKVEEAVELVKKLSYSKFDGTINLAIRLRKSKKGDDAVRGTIKLPNGAGRVLKVAIADEKLIEDIKKGKLDFDILVASPVMMPKLGVVAKVLGPKGKMPNPKDGTVVEDPKGAVEDLGKNIVRYRQDIGGNIHMPIGKVSFDNTKLVDNVNTILKALTHLKKESATLSPTMGPGIKLEI